MITYNSTRGRDKNKSFRDVLLAGMASDGGLYVPDQWPKMDIEKLKHLSYTDLAFEVMYPFVEGSIDADDFKELINDTYDQNNFHHKDIAPLSKIRDNLYTLELFHGPTIAFKDFALQLLGRLFNHFLHIEQKNVTVVGATSGDTGSAAIEGCRICRNTDIFILFPEGRVSDVQRKQMTTIDAQNVHCLAIKGSFDDCQAIVKSLFADEDFNNKVGLSAVNSINWARIMAQIVYYFYAALHFPTGDNEISFVVPTGNFGNVYAAYCARQMGLPIKTLAIASNSNDILTRFFESGTMSKKDVQHTLSPSMDIQISSNFERYLYAILDGDSQRLLTLMDQFKTLGRFSLFAGPAARAHKEFKAFRADDAKTIMTIQDIYREIDMVIDPHTAVGMYGALQLAKDRKNGIVISLACASPAKFPEAVYEATGLFPALPEHLDGLMESEEHMTVLPNSLAKVKAYIQKHSKAAQ